MYEKAPEFAVKIVPEHLVILLDKANSLGHR